MLKLTTNWYGEVTRLPVQKEQEKPLWIYTVGISLFPNVQFQKLNFGIPIGFGRAYDGSDWMLNSRWIFNLSYQIN